MNQEPRRYTRADYRRAVRRRRIKARVGIVSAAAAVLLLVIGAGSRALPSIRRESRKVPRRRLFRSRAGRAAEKAADLPKPAGRILLSGTRNAPGI